MKYIYITLALLIVFTLLSAKNSYNEVSPSEKTSTQSNTIDYKTLSFNNGFEVREYPNLNVAKTILSSNSYSNNSSSGFRKIASYIFGGNSSNQQISMTSPVQMDMGENPTMSFFLPSNLELTDLPEPNRKDVTIHVQPSKIVAVIEFSGWASDKVLNKQFNKLKAKLVEEGIQFENSYSFLGYNPPYKILNRKNEVIINLINYQN